MADASRPRRAGAVAGFDAAEGPAHDGAVVAEEPPDLPRLEDRAGRGRGRAGQPRRTRLRGRAPAGPESPRRRRRATSRHRMRRPGSASSTGATASSAHSLFAIAAPEQQAGPQRSPARGEQHRGDAQRASQQLLGVADFEGVQRQRVGDAQRERDTARERRRSATAHVGDEPHAERGGGQQAGQRDHPVDRKFAAAPETGEQRERRAQHERAAVGGGELQELREVAVHERHERRARLDFVVVPRRTRTVRATPSWLSRMPPRARTGRSHARHGALHGSWFSIGAARGGLERARWGGLAGVARYSARP